MEFEIRYISFYVIQVDGKDEQANKQYFLYRTEFYSIILWDAQTISSCHHCDILYLDHVARSAKR
ncbi:DUF3900 domain-containing protein [Bacillus licheniformis]|nr:DUF3900 domain-containing protein [Bacillus licheniformis]